MAVLGRDVLSKPALRQERVHVEEWGGEVILRELTEEEVVAVNKLRQRGPFTKRGELDATALGNYRRRILRLGWIDEDGNQVLEEADEAELTKQPFAIIDKLAARIAEMSGMMPGASGDAEKNSEATPG